jgi:hypothetical protein
MEPTEKLKELYGVAPQVFASPYPFSPLGARLDSWCLASRPQGPGAFRGVSMLSAPLHRGA